MSATASPAPKSSAAAPSPAAGPPLEALRLVRPVGDTAPNRPEGACHANETRRNPVVGATALPVHHTNVRRDARAKHAPENEEVPPLPSPERRRRPITSSESALLPTAGFQGAQFVVSR